MGLKIAVIAGGAFEAERSFAAANDVMAALKEAEHEPEHEAEGPGKDDGQRGGRERVLQAGDEVFAPHDLLEEGRPLRRREVALLGEPMHGDETEAERDGREDGGEDALLHPAARAGDVEELDGGAHRRTTNRWPSHVVSNPSGRVRMTKPRATVRKIAKMRSGLFSIIVAMR